MSLRLSEILLSTGQPQGTDTTLSLSLSQQSYETLTRFKERFDAAILALQAVGADVPTAEDQAIEFINRLDKSRFAEFQVELANNVYLQVGVYPQSLTDAYNAASRFQVVRTKFRSTNESVQQGSAAAFIAKADTFVTVGSNSNHNNYVSNNNSIKSKMKKTGHVGLKHAGGVQQANTAV